MTLVVERIAAAIERGPERLAIVCGDERLTYREVGERARHLAHELLRRGVAREQLVAIATEASPWAPIAMLGVMQAGAAYVPIDPSYPPARIRDMYEQAGAPLVLATPGAARHLPPGATVIDLDQAMPATGTLPRIDPDALAYVIFTSGSTGRPKGVMVPHRGLANLVAAQIAELAISADSVVLQFAPLSFDASVSEVFTALAAGATLCIAPRDELAPGPRLVELVRRHGVTVATLPPSSLALLDPTELAGIRTVVSAGEACSAALVERWAPRRRFINAYGPTEVTVCATMGVCAPDPAGRAPALGEPIANGTVYLLDGALARVAAGEVGEIFVGGVGVARGYLRQPALTAERFLPDPFAARPGARMYRTGDLARRRDDGSLEFIGRIDHQVKVRGHRIELGEIEAVLRTVAGVRDALAIARDDRLVGYIVADPGLDRGAVRRAVDAALPVFARPTDLVVVPDWPRTPAGKIDRARLPAPVHAGSAAAARSELELRIVEIWQEVLGVARIGPTDDFFELGGHSLLAIRMLARVRDELGVDVPLSRFAEQRTAVGLVALIAARGGRAAVHSPLALRATGHGEPLFLVPPVSGSALVYLPLLRRLAADRPIHAFHAPGLDGRGAPVVAFEELATHFVHELLAVHPRGPHLLCGWSIGGAAAVEMALQLEALGHAVPTLLLVDVNAPTPYLAEGVKQKFGELDPATLAFMYVNNFARCFGIQLGLAKSQFAQLPPDAVEAAALQELRRVPAFPPDMDPARLRAHLAVFGATARGFIRWRPARRYRGRIVLFLAHDGHPEFGPERYDWSQFVEGEVETHEVPGDHFSLVYEPHVAALADALDRVLERLP